MNVICSNNKECKNFDCKHKREHYHYNMCDERCNLEQFYGSTCIKMIVYERKEKIKKLNESRKDM